MDQDVNSIKSTIDQLTKEAKQQMGSAQRIADEMQKLMNKSKPERTKNIVANGHHCNAQQMGDTVQIVFFSSEQAVEFYVAMGDKINVRPPKKSFLQRLFKW